MLLRVHTRHVENRGKGGIGDDRRSRGLATARRCSEADAAASAGMITRSHRVGQMGEGRPSQLLRLMRLMLQTSAKNQTKCLG